MFERMKCTQQPNQESAPRFQRLLRTAQFQVGEFRCHGYPPCTEEEAAIHPEIVLPRIGHYARRDRNGTVLLDRTVIAFFEADTPYTIQHRRRAPDVSTVISIIDPHALKNSLGVELAEGRTFSRSAVRSTLKTALLHRHLLRAIAQGKSDELAAEELAAMLIISAFELTLVPESELTCKRYPESRARELVEAAIDHLEGHFRERVSLDALSAALGTSPFYLCQLFQTALGGTIHQHLLSLRLEAAAAELVETKKTVTEIALGLGFASHSHFTSTFSRTLGLAPRQVRQLQRPINTLVRRPDTTRRV